MRRFLFCAGMILAGAFGADRAAHAQTLPFPPGAKGLITLGHNAPPNAGQPSQNQGRDRQAHQHQSQDHFGHNYGGHHHQGYQYHGSGGWIFSTGFPLVWSGGYSNVYYPFVFEPVFVNPVPFVNLAPPALQPLAIPAPQPPAPAGGANDSPKGKPKATNAEQKAKAGKFIAFGDKKFAKQEYLSAVERYKTALRLAPDVAETYMRQGHALVAMGQYASAVKAFRRGLRIEADWSDAPFRLDELYDQNPVAKVSHLERLAKAVEDNPLDADPLIALGMQLYFDGQQQRAIPFFVRAAQLGGNDDRLLDAFLPKPAPAGEPQRPAGGKIVF